MPTNIARSTTNPTGISLGANLERAARTTHLSRGSRGPAVEELQRALNAHGAALRADGDFGPRTQAAVRDFQRANGLSADGIVGPRTLEALQRAPGRRDDYRPTPPAGPSLNPTRGGSADYDMYAAMVRRAGGQVCPNGQPTVLGLRSAPGASRQYSDQFVVLHPNGTVQRFSGSTNPGQSRSTLSPDVNRDGVGDVGTIRPGNYQAVPNGLYKGSPSFHVRQLDGSGSIPGWRDVNHDGQYSADERARSESRGENMSAILFHPGNVNSPRSIGCQTMSPDTYRQFMSAVGGSSARFTFTLVQV